MSTGIGILSAAVYLPAKTRTVQDIFAEEAVAFTPLLAERLGVDEVHVSEGETSSQLALAAAQKAIQQAGISPTMLDAILDFSILPQDYLSPVWNMSNKIQFELKASKARTFGFSGGGTTNFLVALSTALALIQSDENIHTAMLVAADVAISGNRILNPDYPLTVLGDGASALILQENMDKRLVRDIELLSDGEFHDICYIPGGSLAHPDRPDLYRMQIDLDKYSRAPKMDNLAKLIQNVLGRADLRQEDLAYYVVPNLSLADQCDFTNMFSVKPERISLSSRAQYGHIQGTDLVANLITAMQNNELQSGDPILICSHGMGFLSGVALVEM